MNVQSLARTQSIQVRLNLKDDTSTTFFGFIEHIVETIVTALKHIVEMYDKVMPETAKVPSAIALIQPTPPPSGAKRDET
jgi:hypothetical protein